MKYYFESEEVKSCNECNLYDVDYCRCAVDLCYYRNVLKPKNLEWTDFKDSVKASPFYEIGKLNNHFHVWIVSKFMGKFGTIDEAKKFCQEHYNRVFNEMIGATNETY